MNCTNCGKEIANNAKFCDSCGSPIVDEQVNVQPTTEPAPVINEEQDNKIMFILAYLGILFFLPLVSCPNSKVGRFHANQGLLLFITSIVGSIASTILSSIILAISWRLSLALSPLIWFAWSVVMLVLMIIGMVNANKGEQKPLPIIGKFKIIK